MLSRRRHVVGQGICRSSLTLNQAFRSKSVNLRHNLSPFPFSLRLTGIPLEYQSVLRLCMQK